MLGGQFEHTMDPKNRINFPYRFREALGPGFVLTVGLDGCVAVYPQEEWRRLEEKIRALPLAKGRQIRRFFFSNMTAAEPDRQGRILIPPHLREYAHLKKDLVIIGVSDHVEIWDRESWLESMKSLDPDSMALAMDELGF